MREERRLQLSKAGIPNRYHLATLSNYGALGEAAKEWVDGSFKDDLTEGAPFVVEHADPLLADQVLIGLARSATLRGFQVHVLTLPDFLDLILAPGEDGDLVESQVFVRRFCEDGYDAFPFGEAQRFRVEDWIIQHVEFGFTFAVSKASGTPWHNWYSPRFSNEIGRWRRVAV